MEDELFLNQMAKDRPDVLASVIAGMCGTSFIWLKRKTFEPVIVTYTQVSSKNIITYCLAGDKFHSNEIDMIISESFPPPSIYKEHNEFFKTWPMWQEL